MKTVARCVSEFNMIQVNDEKYFTIKDGNFLRFIPVTCPHRGGPLHFGRFADDVKDKIICPWHENRFRTCKLEKIFFSSVIILDQVKIVVSDKDQVHFWTEILPIHAGNSSPS